MTKKRSDGDGSIYQRHAAKYGCPDAVTTVTAGKTTTTRPKHNCSAPWVGAMVLGYRDGKPIRRRVSANTRSGAATKLRELRQEHEANTLPVGKVPTVEQWMNHWLDNIAARKVGELTLNNSYRQKTRDYIIPLLGSHRLDRLTPDHIEEAWEHLADTGNPKKDDPEPLSANTIHQTHAILRRALKVAVQRKRLNRNPAGADSMDAPPADEKDIEPMTLEEVRKVLTLAEGRRNAVRWSLALALGLRQGEALGLPWWDPSRPEQGGLDLDAEVVRIRRALKRVKGKGLVYGPVKSKKSKRDIPIPPELMPLVKAHRKAQTAERLAAGSAWEDSGLVCCQVTGKPLDPSRDHRTWKAMLTEAGVRKYRLHDARHSAATLLMLQGVQPRVVQELLGHSQISVTMRYQHAVDELKKAAVGGMGAALYRS